MAKAKVLTYQFHDGLIGRLDLHLVPARYVHQNVPLSKIGHLKDPRQRLWLGKGVPCDKSQRRMCLLPRTLAKILDLT